MHSHATMMLTTNTTTAQCHTYHHHRVKPDETALEEALDCHLAPAVIIGIANHEPRQDEKEFTDR